MPGKPTPRRGAEAESSVPARGSRSVRIGRGVGPIYKAYGIPAVRTGRPDELAVAVKEAFSAAQGPHMIIVDVTPGVRLAG